MRVFAVETPRKGGRNPPDIEMIDVYICKLRKKLAQAIGMVWGRGCVLNDSVDPSSELATHP
jgi:two-component system cell cycle response regulator CtrA